MGDEFACPTASGGVWNRIGPGNCAWPRLIAYPDWLWLVKRVHNRLPQGYASDNNESIRIAVPPPPGSISLNSSVLSNLPVSQCGVDRARCLNASSPSDGTADQMEWARVERSLASSANFWEM
jgi:hypothetical protein